MRRWFWYRENSDGVAHYYDLPLSTALRAVYMNYYEQNQVAYGSSNPTSSDAFGGVQLHQAEVDQARFSAYVATYLISQPQESQPGLPLEFWLQASRLNKDLIDAILKGDVPYESESFNISSQHVKVNTISSANKIKHNYDVVIVVLASPGGTSAIHNNVFTALTSVRPGGIHSGSTSLASLTQTCSPWMEVCYRIYEREERLWQSHWIKV